MENIQDNNPNDIPDPEDIRERFEINDDSDTLEPFDDASEHRLINDDDPKDIAYWAAQFQISTSQLRDAIALNGNAVRQIKKFLSV